MKRSYTHRKHRKAKKDSGNIFTLDTSMLGKHLQDVSSFYSGGRLFYSRCAHMIGQRYGEADLMPTPQNTTIIPLEHTCISNANLENKLPESSESLGTPAQVRTFFRLLPGRLILLTALLVPSIDSNIVKMLRTCIGLHDNNHNEATNRLVSLQREELLVSAGKQQYALTRNGAQALISFLLSYKDILAAFGLPVPVSEREPDYIATAIGNIFMARVHPARKKASSPHRLAITTIYIHTLIHPRPADSGTFFVTPESPLRWDLSAEAIGNRILDVDFRMFPIHPGRRASFEVDCGTEQITKAAKGTSLLDKLAAYTSVPIRDEERTLKDIIFLVTTTQAAPKKVTKAEKGVTISKEVGHISPAKYRHLLDLQICLSESIQYYCMFPEQIDMSLLKGFFVSFSKSEFKRLSPAMQEYLNLLKATLDFSEPDGVNDLFTWLDWVQQLGRPPASVESKKPTSDLTGLPKNSRGANILSAILACPANSPIRRAVKTGTLIAAAPYKSWDIIHILEPEQWFGFRSIWRAFVNLSILYNNHKYLSLQNNWSLKYNHPLLRSFSKKLYDNYYSAYEYDYFVRLALLSDKAVIAIENVSHDAGGLIRARDIISSMPANLGRRVLLVLLCADDYALADGTNALNGGMCIDNAGRKIEYPDCENQRSGIWQEYTYYQRKCGWTFINEKYDVYTPRPNTDHKYYALPYLAGSACDFVLITYRQFLDAVNGKPSFGLTVLSETSIQFRFADEKDRPVKPFRRLEDRSRVDNF